MSRTNSTRAQERKHTGILVACALMGCSFFCRASANDRANDLHEDAVLQVYLPREVTVQDSFLRLGQVSIIRGGESLVAKASEIALGRLSVPGQKITIHRPMVLSRLACNGIPASKVRQEETGKTLATIFFEKTVSGMHTTKHATAILKSTSNRRPNTFFAN